MQGLAIIVVAAVLGPVIVRLLIDFGKTLPMPPSKATKTHSR
jgi:hypothetical protein